MAILTDAEKAACARQMARRLFANATANRDVTTLVAIVDRIDQYMEATTTQAAALYPGVAMQNVIVQHVRAGAGLSDATVTEIAAALAYWCMKKAGI